jgi:hypothetical protein
MSIPKARFFSSRVLEGSPNRLMDPTSSETVSSFSTEIDDLQREIVANLFHHSEYRKRTSWGEPIDMRERLS